MSYPDSGSLIDGNINTGLSTQFLVKVGNTAVGAIQQIVVRQNRDMNIWEEIGNDGIIEIHPKGATKIELDVNRVVFDGMRLPEAFSRGFINIQSQRIPFDILLIDRSTVKNDKSWRQDVIEGFSKVTNVLGELGVGIKATEPYYGHVVHIFNNCWFRSYSPTYKADDFVILENATLVCEYVTSMTDGKNVSDGGLRGIQYDYDTMERNTDLTGIRGKFYSVTDNRSAGWKLLDAIF